MNNLLLIHEPPLQVLPSLAVAVGLNEAIILQQMHYWLQRSDNIINGHSWVYNSVVQWNKQFPFWSDDTIARALKSLRTKGVVIAEHLSENPRDRSLYYRIDYDVLQVLAAECITAICGNGYPQIAEIPIYNRDYYRDYYREKGEACARARNTTSTTHPHCCTQRTKTQIQNNHHLSHGLCPGYHCTGTSAKLGAELGRRTPPLC